MPTKSYRGVLCDGTVVLESDTQLAEGTEVVVTPVASEPGSSAAVLEALDQAPRVPTGWVDELEELIAEGRRPPARLEPFSEMSLGHYGLSHERCRSRKELR